MLGEEEGAKRIIGCFERIFDAKPDLSQFSDRLAIQKIAYLLRNFNIAYTAYSFIWHWRGVYSPLLGSEVCQLIGKEQQIEGQISNNDRIALDEIKRILPEGKEQMINYLELYTSILFFQKEGVIEPTDLVARIRFHKPWYSEEQILKSISELSKISIAR